MTDHHSDHAAIAARLAALGAEARLLANDQQAVVLRQMAALEDVTSGFAGLEEEDRVYRSPDGTLVKVKTFDDDETDHGLAAALVMTGSVVGPDGKALRRPDSGKPAVFRDVHHHHVHAFTLGDPEAEEEASRRLKALQTLSAERKHQAARARADGPTRGVGRLSRFKARKAAEAGVAEPAALAELHAEVDPTQWKPPASAPPERARKHASGRRYVLFPGLALRGGTTVLVTPAELAAAYNVKLGQCVVFSEKRPHTYFADLVELHPLAEGATYPDLGAAQA